MTSKDYCRKKLFAVAGGRLLFKGFNRKKNDNKNTILK